MENNRVLNYLVICMFDYIFKIKIIGMVHNEQTSKEVASYASELLTMDRPFGVSIDLWKKIKAVAGSALTQTSDSTNSTIAQIYAKQALATRNAEIEKKRIDDAIINSVMQNFWK